MDADTELHDFAGEHFCDVHLLSLEWLEPGPALQLRLRLPMDNERPPCEVRLICRWAHDLKLTLDFPPYDGSKPFTSEGRVEQVADGTWIVWFEFASQGELRLRCTDVEWVEEG